MWIITSTEFADFSTGVSIWVSVSSDRFMNTTDPVSPTHDNLTHSIELPDTDTLMQTMRDYGIARDARDFLIALDCPTISAMRIGKLLRVSRSRILRIAESYDWFHVQSLTDHSRFDHNLKNGSTGSITTVTTTPLGNTVAETDTNRDESQLTADLEFLKRPHKPINDDTWEKLRTQLIQHVSRFDADSLPCSLV